MGNLVEMHCEKRRGFGIEDVGKEMFIDWNGLPVHQSDSLGIKTLNRLFKGTKWHFVTVTFLLITQLYVSMINKYTYY